MFFTTALLQQSSAAGGTNPMLMNIILFGGIIFLFYFLLIRPQSKARKALEEKLSKLKSGDEVLLTSGLYAIVDRVDGNLLYLKIGGAIVKARRNAVAALASESDASKNPSVIS